MLRHILQDGQEKRKRSIIEAGVRMSERGKGTGREGRGEHVRRSLTSSRLFLSLAASRQLKKGTQEMEGGTAKGW